MFTEKEAREKVCLPMALKVATMKRVEGSMVDLEYYDLPKPQCLASECIKWEWDDEPRDLNFLDEAMRDVANNFRSDGFNIYPERGHCSCGGKLEK